jgi:hypothetical protein
VELRWRVRIMVFNACLPPLTLWVRTPIRRCVLDTTLCDKVYQWLAAGRWFSPVSSINKTDRHDITEIMLKVALNTIILTLHRNSTLEKPLILELILYIWFKFSQHLISVLNVVMCLLAFIFMNDTWQKYAGDIGRLFRITSQPPQATSSPESPSNVSPVIPGTGNVDQSYF